MRLRILHIVAPIGLGILAYFYVPIQFWKNGATALIPMLSVLAAGVLVRLARGIPFSNSTHFTVEEARKISQALKRSVRSLRVVAFSVFLTMGAIAFAVQLVNLTQRATTEAQAVFPWFDAQPEALISTLIMVLFAYSGLRLVSVISGDVGLVDLQSDYLVAHVERSQASRFDVQSARTKDMVKTPEGFGKSAEPNVH